ncbi:MAG: ATP-binding protein [Pseudomonadales bacterium]
MHQYLRGYALAIAALLAATLARWLLDPYLGLFVPFPTYFVAVALVGLYAGYGPALLTMFAGGLIADNLFMPSRDSLLMSEQEHWVSLGLFFASASVVIAMAEWLRSSKTQLMKALALGQRDLEQRRQAEAEARGSQVRLQAIIDNSPLVLFIKDDHGRYLLANRSYYELFETTPEQLLGITDFDRFDQETADSFWRNDLEVIRSGQAQEFEESAQINGELRTYTSIKFPLYDDTGRVYAACGISMDITEQKRQQQELRDIDRRKDEFLAMLAHELRNPLAPIVTAVELLRLGGADEHRRQRAVEVIARQAQHLTHLVDDLLDIARINTGRILLKREVMDITPLVQQAADAARPRFEAGGIDLVVALPDEALQVDGDRARLLQVIDNLLDNACKYTDSGGRVELRLRHDGPECVVSVRDTGIGIEQQNLCLVFELFEQVDAGLDRSAGGLGLGLNLVKRIVERHGGRVQARSDGLGHGSEFVVHLPLTEGQAPAPAAGAAASAGGGRRVLVIDDNRDAAESLEFLLQDLGYEVRVALDGHSGLIIAEAFQPHTVLLDLGLPGLDGYEVARRLRERFGQALRLVAVTGYGQAEHQQRSRAAGFDQHLVKPVAIETLSAALAKQPAQATG